MVEMNKGERVETMTLLMLLLAPFAVGSITGDGLVLKSHLRVAASLRQVVILAFKEQEGAVT